MVKKWVSSLIGVLFILSPWSLGYAFIPKVMSACFILGGMMIVCSLLSMIPGPQRRLLTWLCLLAGVAFIVFIGGLHLSIGIFLWSIGVGIAGVLVNYYILFPSGSD